MKYTRSSGQTVVGPADWFTGTVYIDGIRNPDEQSAVGCTRPVRPRRSHRLAPPPQGTDPYVTDGVGLVGTRDGGVQEIRTGDVVYIGTRRGALARRDAGYRFMAHVAIQEADDSGQVVTWLDHVTDAEYGA